MTAAMMFSERKALLKRLRRFRDEHGNDLTADDLDAIRDAIDIIGEHLYPNGTEDT